MTVAGIAPIQLLVVQPTAFCNINCTYCYLPHRNKRARMHDDTLRAIGSKLVASAFFRDNTTLVWHAGEPLVLPPDWYRHAVEILEAESGRQIQRQTFQTNATLISDAWLDYFLNPGVSVGVSLDGPEDLNDRFRMDRQGRGTWRATMLGIERLHAKSVPFHIIAVVTEASLDRPEDVAQALVGAGPTSIGLNLEEIDGTNENSSLLTSATQARVRRFLDRFLDVLEATPNPPLLREAEKVTNLLAALQNHKGIRNQENAPGAILSVDVEGNVSTYSPELLGVSAPEFDDFQFGNVSQIKDLSEIFLNRTFLKCHKEVSDGVARCRSSCGYFALCGGGSPSNKFGEAGRLDVTETAFCRLAVKTVLDHLVDRCAVPVPKAEV